MKPEQKKQDLLQRLADNYRNCVSETRGEPLPWSVLEYIEFIGGDEFRRRTGMPIITADECAAVDLDELAKDLQEKAI